MASERWLRAMVTWWWWDQRGVDLDLGGGRTASREMKASMEASEERDEEERRGGVE